MNRIFLFIALMGFWEGLSAQSIKPIHDTLLRHILKGKDPLIDQVLNNPSKFEFQLIYTQIKRDQKQIAFEEHSINKDSAYFYPASLIKFPLAIVALEYLDSLKMKGVDPYSSLNINTCSCDEATNQYVRNSMNNNWDQFLREMLIMSDNDAYNLFFDLVGMHRFNQRMRSLGYNGILMKKRFTSGCTDALNSIHGGISMLDKDGSLVFKIPCEISSTSYKIDTIFKTRAGRFIYDQKKKIKGSKDFSASNFVRLADANNLMLRLFFPESVSNSEHQFKFDSIYRNMLIHAIGDFPSTLSKTQTDYSKTPDCFYKFLVDPKIMQTSSGKLHIYNKVGLASGFLSDVSYIVDDEKNISYFIAMAIWAKKDGVINHGDYNYYDFGIPVMRKIGGLIYQYECELKK